jgi:hypothetical protein
MFAKHTARSLMLAFTFAVIAAAMVPSVAHARQDTNKVMGELQFSGATKVDKNAGVWIDGQYVGYVDELKGDKKIMLLPGQHDVSIRRAAYKDFVQQVNIEPGQAQLVAVRLEKDPGWRYPSKGDEATLKVTVVPERAAVFLDGGYIGHASDFGGAFHAMLVMPGTHQIKIELAGYKTFETEVNARAHQKTEIKTELVKDSGEQAGAVAKQ